MGQKEIAYDPELIQEFAQRLYKLARSIVAAHIFLGLIFGVIVGGVVFPLLRPGVFPPGIFIGAFALIGAVIGYSIGSEKAFKLRLEAQLALCQVEIEKHGRK